ncbi:AAA family ATPase [Antrihabitans sp. NCIMB 15449]|uniref:Nuclease SbcCD subunit C n=1 Tax=Antrihabitans spumae TaxID=3373370 RepID=A0ABW7JM89_9NOCA
MRLHKLEVTAFGPFADTATVDFDALGTDGLFLLHGNTGAGKTTVLDAIAFALYGTVPGARSECKRLHSDHAPAGVVPQVVLEATIGGRRLRLVRSPQHERPKLRSAGVRVENAKATLTWLDGGRNLTRIPEIGDEINKLLGMSADQFFQVVLLPQGEFARFLCAENDERQRLLERLFDTERFGRAEDWLANRRRTSADRLADRLQAVDRLLAQICTAAGVAEPEPDALEWAQQLLAEARTAKAATEQHLRSCEGVSTDAAQRLADARRTADLQRRMATAAAQLEAYDSSAEDRQRVTNELARARRAESVAASLTATTAAKEYAAKTFWVFEHASAELADLLEGAELAGAVGWPAGPADSAVIDAAVRRWTEEISRLDDVVADSKECLRLQSARDALVAERDDLTAKAAAHNAERELLPDVLRSLEDDLRCAVETAATLPARIMRRDDAADANAAAVEYRRQTATLTGARERVNSLRTRQLEAKEHVLALRERRLAGMAAELAGALVDGQPCQVCGSAEHPSRAEPVDDSVSESDERLAAAAEAAAVTERDAAIAVLASVERCIDALVGRGGDRATTELAEELAAADAAVAHATSAQRHSIQLEQKLIRERKRADHLDGVIRDAERRLSALAERITTTDERIAALRDRAGTAMRSDETAEEALSKLDLLVHRTLRWRDVRTEASTAAAAAEQATYGVERLAADNGFESAAAAAAARRSNERQRAIEQVLADAADLRAHAKAVLGDPDVIAVRDLPPADLEALSDTNRRAAADLHAALVAHTEAAQRANQLEELTAHLWSALDRLAPMRDDHDELERVAELVAGRGQNSRRMSLRSYVLAARLEEVAIAASAQLRRMSGGRYEFLHTDARGSRGKRGGLGLDISDDYTGSVRPAKTLSGGESFTAALALALGLADVVAAESGGLILDTLFIDEGFGGLDDEALDSVMGVLDELRAGGRVVGVVSHVDEMRQRIPNRLHVIRGRAGSRLEAQVAG